MKWEVALVGFEARDVWRAICATKRLLLAKPMSPQDKSSSREQCESDEDDEDFVPPVDDNKSDSDSSDALSSKGVKSGQSEPQPVQQAPYVGFTQ
jgi:hypothetical protein